MARRAYPDLPAPVVAAMGRGEISTLWVLDEDDDGRLLRWRWRHAYLPRGGDARPSVVETELATTAAAVRAARFDLLGELAETALGRMRRAERIVTRPGGRLVPMPRQVRRGAYRVEGPDGR